MYGCERAMDGNSREGMPQCGKARLVVCLMLSLGVHSLLLFLQVSQTGSVVGANTMIGQRESGRLQVFLAPRVGEIHVKRISADTENAAVTSGHTVRESSKLRQSDGFSGVLPEKEPELMSEIDSEIDDPRVRGFMILRVQINESGAVDVAEVIYSELPSDVAELLVKRFGAAWFKPAVRNGKATEASILLRIDID